MFIGGFYEKEKMIISNGCLVRQRKFKNLKYRKKENRFNKKFFSVSENPNYKKIYETYLRAYLAK